MIDRLKSKLTGNKKNVAKISFGTISGYFISFVTLPILARIYGSQVIGMWTVLHASVAVINSFSDIGLTNSIMVDEAANIERTYRVVTTISLVLSIASSAVVSTFYLVSSQFSQLNPLFLFLTLSFSAFTSQQIQVCYTWLNRMGEYNTLMKNPVIMNATYGVSAIILGLITTSAYGYFIGHMVGQTVTLYHMKRQLPTRMLSFSRAEFADTIKKNKRFVGFQMPTNILANFKNQLPVFLIDAFWGTNIVGYYSVSVRFLQIPSSVLANAIGRVFFQTVSRMKREGKQIGEYVYNNLARAMKISIVPMALLIAFGDIMIAFLFGNEWSIAGNLLRILVLQYFFMFLMNTVRGLSMTLEKQSYAMISTISQSLGYLSGAAIGSFVFGSIYMGIFLMTSFFIVINIIYFSALFRVMEISTRKYVMSVVGSLSAILLLSSLVRVAMVLFGLVDSFL